MATWEDCCVHFASSSPSDLKGLRLHPAAMSVFDHVPLAYATRYLQLAKDYLPTLALDACVSGLERWDIATGGKREVPVGDSVISCTACKYVGLLGKLVSLVGELPTSVVEFGGGFGGFACMLAALRDATGHPIAVTVVDLPHTCACIGNVCRAAGFVGITTVFSTDTAALERMPPTHVLVAEHSWSECTTSAREMYAQTLFSKAQFGWLTCNSLLGSDSLDEASTVSCCERAGCAGTIRSDVFCGDRSFTVTFRNVASSVPPAH